MDLIYSTAALATITLRLQVTLHIHAAISSNVSCLDTIDIEQSFMMPNGEWKIYGSINRTQIYRLHAAFSSRVQLHTALVSVKLRDHYVLLVGDRKRPTKAIQ